MNPIKDLNDILNPVPENIKRIFPGAVVVPLTKKDLKKIKPKKVQNYIELGGTLKKQLWELSIEEIDMEISITKRMIEKTKSHFYMDHLAALQTQREERLIETDIVKGSRYAQDVLRVGEKPFED